MKYYQVIDYCIDGNCCDEWLLHDGYDEAEAIEICRKYRNACKDKRFCCEVRVFDTDVPFEELDVDEQCCVLSCYDIIEVELCK